MDDINRNFGQFGNPDGAMGGFGFHDAGPGEGVVFGGSIALVEGFLN